MKYLDEILRRKPDAQACLSGSKKYPALKGNVRFYGTCGGVLVCAEVIGLPKGKGCKSPVFGFHIHQGGECSGSAKDPFANAEGHYNPDGCPHPFHAGDLPPLLGADGAAFSVFLTDRFRVNEIAGKTVIIHAMPDDFTIQPSGNSGEKIACGIIKPVHAC